MVNAMQTKNLTVVTLRAQCKNDFVNELLWAKEIDPSKYQLKNVPFFSNEYSLGDIVEADSYLIVQRLVEKHARTVHLGYSTIGNRSEIKQRYRAIRAYLKQAGFRAAHDVLGYFSLAVPLNMSDEKLNWMLQACDEDLKLASLEECWIAARGYNT